MPILKLAAALALAASLTACGDDVRRWANDYEPSYRPTRVVYVQSPPRVVYRSAPTRVIVISPAPRRSHHRGKR